MTKQQKILWLGDDEKTTIINKVKTSTHNQDNSNWKHRNYMKGNCSRLEIRITINFLLNNRVQSKKIWNKMKKN